jgi:hypothetical protein
MSTNESLTNGTAAGPATGSEPLTPEAIAEQLRALRSHVPDFTHLRVSDARSLRVAAMTNPDFVQASINAAGAAANVESLLGKNSSEMRQETEDAGRWTEVEDELRAMLKGVSTANLVRRHRIGTAALLTYQVVRQLAKQPQYRYLLPHLEEMKRKNRFGIKRSATPATTPPQPAPQQPSPQQPVPSHPTPSQPSSSLTSSSQPSSSQTSPSQASSSQTSSSQPSPSQPPPSQPSTPSSTTSSQSAPVSDLPKKSS